MAHFSDADFCTHCPAACQQIAFLFELIDLQDSPLFSRLYRFGACLYDVELPVITVFCPLHIHRFVVFGFLRVVIFYFDGEIGKHHDIFIRDAEVTAFVGCCFDIFGIFESDIVAVGQLGKDHFELFFAQAAFEYRTKTCIESRFMHIETVRIDSALHDIFSQAVCRVDEDNIFETGLGVEAEHHPAGCFV